MSSSDTLPPTDSLYVQEIAFASQNLVVLRSLSPPRWSVISSVIHPFSSWSPSSVGFTKSQWETLCFRWNRNKGDVQCLELRVHVCCYDVNTDCENMTAGTTSAWLVHLSSDERADSIYDPGAKSMVPPLEKNMVWSLVESLVEGMVWSISLTRVRGGPPSFPFVLSPVVAVRQEFNQFSWSKFVEASWKL